MSAESTPGTEDTSSTATQGAEAAGEEEQVTPLLLPRESFAVMGLRFLAMAALWFALRHVLYLWLVQGTSPTNFKSFVLLNGMEYGIHLLLLVAVYYLGRGATTSLDRSLGLLLYFVQFGLVFVLFWRNSPNWLPGLDQRFLPTWIRTYGTTILQYGVPLVLAGTAARLGWRLHQNQQTGSSGASLISWQWLGVAGLFVVSLVGLYQASLAATVWSSALALFTASHLQRHHRQVLQSQAEWLRGYFNLRTIFALFLLLLALMLFIDSIALMAQMTKKLHLIHAFTQTAPLNSLYLSGCLVLCLWGLTRVKQDQRARLWYWLCILSLGTATLLHTILFVRQYARMTLSYSPPSLTSIESWMSVSAVFLSWLTILLFLTALKHTAQHFDDRFLARKVGNLRWIIVGFSLFSWLMMLTFVAMMGNKVGSLFVVFVGGCIFLGSVMLLALVFVNIHETISLIRRKVLTAR